MIPPVDRPVTGSEFEDEDIIFRPEWVKWYYHRYESATQSFDDDQHGWYMRLLMHAATQGNPPGHLPEDDEELRYIAGIKDLAALAYEMFGVLIEPSEWARQKRDKKWKRVLSKFRKSSTVPGTIYNRTLVSTLREAKRRSKFAAQAAKDMQTMRKAKRAEERELAAGAKRALSGSSADALSLSFSSYKDSIESLPSLEEPSEKESLVLSLSEEEQEVLIPESNSDSDLEEKNLVEKNPPFLGKRKRKPETFFDSNKWNVTPKMIAHLLTKYKTDEIERGDVDYLAEKFSMVHAESKYSNWAMAFYNFVDNQLTKYGYEFGMYKRRGKRNVGQTRTDQPRLGEDESDGKTTRTPPWKQLESSADRNARLEREADEYSRGLLTRGSGGHSQSTSGLPLTADDTD